MIDLLDYKILDILQKDNLTPQRDIGDSIGLSAPAVQRRIKKMRESGVIKKNISVIDREKVGNSITLLVEIILENEKTDNIDAMQKAFIEAPEVQQCFYVIGESDFFLVVVVHSMSHYESLCRQLFYNNENIKRFRTIVSMGLTKIGLEIPLLNKQAE